MAQLRDRGELRMGLTMAFRYTFDNFPRKARGKIANGSITAMTALPCPIQNGLGSTTRWKLLDSSKWAQI